MLSLAGKTALVTGASRRNGLGATIALALANAGADVGMGYYRPYDLGQSWSADHENDVDAILDEIAETDVRTAGFEVDLAQSDGPSELFEKTISALGPVDILINNAAYSRPAGIDGLNADTLDAHYAVNLRAVALLCAEFADRFDKKIGGRIIMITSGQGSGPMPGELAYAATKGGVDALTVSLAAAIADRGITVNAIDPGATDTGWIDPELRATLLRTAPMNRLGMPEDAARLVAFLASDDAAWITGQIIRSRGGS